MDIENETNAQAATVDAEALKAAQAGYSRRRGTTPTPAPAPVEAEPPLADTDPTPAPAAEDAPAADGVDEPGLEAEPAAVPPAQEAISTQLEDLKAQIRELKASGVDASTVHRLFGEIGGITRVVKQLQAKAAPSESELAGALKKAEETAREYPEIGEPMLAALKALAAQLPAKTEPEPEPSAPQFPTQAPAAAPPQSQYTPEELVKINLLHELHPDRHDVAKSPEFKAWLSAKGADYQTRFMNSWDFAFVTKELTEFKAAQAAKAAAKQRKTERLEAAVTPTGTAANPQPTTETPEAQARRGYQRYAGKRL